MKKILIFGGTTEGRRIAEVLSQNKIFCDVCVATQYGEELLCENQFVHVKRGRLTAGMMASLYKNGYSLVIDATHPYASEASENIKKSLADFNRQGGSLLLFRLERSTGSKNDFDCSYFEGPSDCAKKLLEEDGKILLTTGTKELEAFCAYPQIRERLVARVLPSPESIQICKKNGLEGRQIIAMQGPFSQEMNYAHLLDYKIRFLVTKQSGKVGGFEEKLSAAKKVGAKVFVIKKPEVSYDACDAERFDSLEGLFMRIEELFSQKITFTEAALKIVIAGLGMGSPGNATHEVLDAIKNADLIFGAERLLQAASGVNKSARKYPYYLAKDIIPLLEELKACGSFANPLTAVILFSGDIGFYSGADNFYAALQESLLKNEEIILLPGVSCVQYLAAKFHTSWQDSQILSLHGVDREDWLNKLYETVYKTRQIFFISSSFFDVRSLGTALCEISSSSGLKFRLKLGFQLSYPDEKLMTLLPGECEKISAPGLYSGIIEVENE